MRHFVFKLVLVLPIGIVLFLHTFGENRMDIPVLSSLENCVIKKGTHLLLLGDATSNAQKNQLGRINKRLASKRMVLDTAYDSCFSDSLALLMIDQRSNLRGVYELEHNDINRFFAELDILLMTENYGEGVSK